MEFHQPRRIPMRLDMAPLIDVVFLLLVFFMLTSSMAQPKALELVLPKSSESVAQEDTPITVSINKTGQVFLNEKPSSLESLAGEVQALIQNGSSEGVTLELDSETPVQSMVSVMDELKKAGGGRIALATGENQ